MPAAFRISVRAKPNAKISSIIRADGLEIEAALAAPPSEGAANRELIRLLAEALELPKSALALKHGKTSKRKLVEVAGITPDEAVSRLAKSVRRRG